MMSMMYVDAYIIDIMYVDAGSVCVARGPTLDVGSH